MAKEQDVLFPPEQTDTERDKKPMHFKLEEMPRKRSYQSRDKKRKAETPEE